MPRKQNYKRQKYGFRDCKSDAHSGAVQFAVTLPQTPQRMAAWYTDWFDSAYYHRLYPQNQQSTTTAFLQRMLDRLKPAAGARLLDSACGTGGNAKWLSDAGFDVTGVDGSEANVVVAQPLESHRLQFYKHDIRLPFWMGYFDMAVNLETAFGYFPTQREHDNAVRTLAQSLKPNGVLVFDYLNVHYAEAHGQQHETKVVETTGFDIHRWHDATHFYKRIVVTDAALEKPFDVTEKMSKFSLGDFTDMLAYQYMQVVDVFGDYDLSRYDVHRAPRMIILARKQSRR